MIKCQFCHFENEDGALFCERCTSDLSSAQPAARPAPPPPPPVMVEAIPLSPDDVFAEPLPMALAEPIEVMPIVTAEPMAVPALQLEAIPETKPAPAPAPEPVPVVEDIPLIPGEPLAKVEPAPAPAPAPAPVHVADAQAGALPAGAQPRLLVLRGQKRNVEYPLYEGLNFIGRADEKPVDIDLEEQEPPDRIWCSRQHACIAFENDHLVIEDLNSANGTYVNRTKVYPGQKRTLAINDVIQIGNVQLKVLV